jgi:hypothetical protein
MTPQKPEDLFRQEKERALTVRNSQHARLLAEAKAAFDKLMAEGQAARKSGRPRKHPLPPLKTTSSRPPVKPTPPAPVAKVAMAAPVKAAPMKVAKPEVRAAAKPAEPPKKVAKAGSRSAPGRAESKSKAKAKRSTRR